MNDLWDALVVGSGPAGVNAAWPLVEEGLRVAMVDVGNRDQAYAPLVPAQSWSEIRRTDPGQHRYFLGDRFEGIPLGNARVGAQLTPPRQHLLRHSDRLLPLESSGFEAIRGLALGGLGAAWGAGAFPFRDEELRGIPITESDLRPHYERVHRRIGVAGAEDDLEPFFGDSYPLLPPAELDRNSEILLERYRRHRKTLNRHGWYMGHPRLAVCTSRFCGRGPLAYRDMEFWADTDRSVYRPQWTLEELHKEPNFSYRPGWVAERFLEDPDGSITLLLRSVESGTVLRLRARSLVLAAGTLESARIALRSLGLYDAPVPLLSNPYTYLPVLNLGMLNREERDRRHSLAQLSGVLAPQSGEVGVTQVQYYTYRSLLTFKIAKELPLPVSTAMEVVRHLTPLLGIVAINHEDRPAPGKRCLLVRRGRRGETGTPSGDLLRIEYSSAPGEERQRRKAERRIARIFLRLRCLPLRMMRLPPGSSIHYAGTIPMGLGPEPLTCSSDGLLSGTRRVYVADGSIFRYLPAKGLTLTIMAHADRVGTLLAASLGSPEASRSR